MEIKHNFGFWCEYCEAIRHVEEFIYTETDDFYVWKVKCPVCKKKLTLKQKSIMAYIRELKEN